MENSRSNTTKSYRKTMIKSSDFSMSSKFKTSLVNEPANKKSEPVWGHNNNNCKNVCQGRTDVKNGLVSPINMHKKQRLNVDFLNNKQDSECSSYFLDDGNIKNNSCSIFLDKFQSNNQNMQSVAEMESYSPQKYRGSRPLSSIDLNIIQETKIQSNILAKLELPDSKIIKSGQSSMKNSSQNKPIKLDDSKVSLLKSFIDIGEPVDNTKVPRVIFEKYDVTDDDILMKLSEISSLKLNA